MCHLSLTLVCNILIFVTKLCVCDEDNDDLPHVTMDEMYMAETAFGDNVTTSILDSQATSNITENSFESNNTDLNSPWLNKAIRDIAYFLRAYKFNEYDRRYNMESPSQFGEYFVAFPKPPLRSLHWEVHKYCEPSFIHCIEYLEKRVKGTLLKREDDTSVVMNEQNWNIYDNKKQVHITEEHCQEMKKSDENLTLPFEGPLERFQWRTTASYYMCWYAMNGVPNLEHIDEPCDNFAQCLMPEFGSNNQDPRALDSIPFACALYSFCPDICCPMRHIVNNSSCFQTEINPCYSENHLDIDKLQCLFDRNQNTDFKDIVLNRWNVTCECSEPGYVWESRYGMCVDINECTGHKHNCDVTTEVCLNLPGSFRCACNWGYVWSKEEGQCMASPALTAIKAKRLEKNITKESRMGPRYLLTLMLKKMFGKSSATMLQVFNLINLIKIIYSVGNSKCSVFYHEE